MTMKIKSISSQKNLKNKTVLVRVDFNVPLKSGKIQDDFKIIQSLPTIKYLHAEGAKIVLVTHLGRPDGYDKTKSTRPLSGLLSKKLRLDIKFLPAKDLLSYWEDAGQMILRMKAGQVLLLENIRFFAGEDKNDKNLAKDLSGLADVFVLDGFAVSHREAASVSGVSKNLPTFAGLLLEKEIIGLNKVMIAPKKPMVAVLGGVKMETKIPVLKSLLPKATNILVGGGIFNNYLWAKGYSVGNSLVDKNFKKEALGYGKIAKVIFPIDVIVGLPNGKKARVVKIDKHFMVPAGESIFDIGPATIELFAKYIKKAQTLVWNGAMGYFEQHPYEFGTRAIGYLFAERSVGKAYGVVGGGETVEVLRSMDVISSIDLISTGGGAMLEYLSGKILPGVKVVLEK